MRQQTAAARAVPITVDDRPDSIVEGSMLGNVSYREWCEEERRRLALKGVRAIVQRTSLRLQIRVAVLP